MRLDQSLNVTSFNDLPNELYFDIFNYLSAFDIIQSFYGLNYRLNAVIRDIPMKLNFNKLNYTEHKRVLTNVVPKLLHQTVAIDLGQISKVNRSFSLSYNSESLIDLFMQSYNFTQFLNLRRLSLTAPSRNQLESLFSVIPNMSSLRSLRLLEQNYPYALNETICKLVLSNKRYSSNNWNDHNRHLFIETSPPFTTLNLLHKYLNKKISFDRIQINICGTLFYLPQLSKHIDFHNLTNLISNMTYFKINLICGTHELAFDVIQRFSMINHLSVKTNLKAYANGHQWAELLAQMSNIIKLDLDIDLDSYNSDQELQTFQTKFWSERQWIVQCAKSHPSHSAKYKIVHLSN